MRRESDNEIVLIDVATAKRMNDDDREESRGSWYNDIEYAVRAVENGGLGVPGGLDDYNAPYLLSSASDFVLCEEKHNMFLDRIISRADYGK